MQEVVTDAGCVSTVPAAVTLMEQLAQQISCPVSLWLCVGHIIFIVSHLFLEVVEIIGFGNIVG